MDCGCGKQSLTNPETSCNNSKYQFSMAALRPTRSFPALPQQERSARVKTFEDSKRLRNIMLVNQLKTNTSAKSPISRHNDFKGLRGDCETAGFVRRKGSLRFGRFLARSEGYRASKDATRPDGPIAAAPGERVERPRVEIGAATD